MLTAKAKYSVSEIRRTELETDPGDNTEPMISEDDDDGTVSVTQADTEAVNLWRSTDRRKKASYADIGIAYHRIMEFIDFTKVADAEGRINEDYIKERAEYLRDQNAIESEVFESLDISRITAFFDCQLGKRTLAAAVRGSLKREKPFTLRTERNGRELLVQGVIDCCFEEDGSMILIDYKSGFVMPGKGHEDDLKRIRDEYRVQIDLYREAVKKGTGLDVSEAYLYLLASGEAVRI